jgi:hypothetical protein
MVITKLPKLDYIVFLDIWAIFLEARSQERAGRLGNIVNRDSNVMSKQRVRSILLLMRLNFRLKMISKVRLISCMDDTICQARENVDGRTNRAGYRWEKIPSDTAPNIYLEINLFVSKSVDLMTCQLVYD